MRPSRLPSILHVTTLLLLVIRLTPIVAAHTPLQSEGENTSLGTALAIPNPTKSWTLYRELHEAGETEYFRLHLHAGERFVVSVYTPRSTALHFVPNLVVMGPRVATESPAPDAIEVPPGAAAALVVGHRPAAPEYEPFTPASYFFTAEYRADVTVDGDYFFAVYADAGEGRYGVAVGYVETFTLTEWLRIPLDVIGIHQWEGQSLPFILAPMALTLALGLGLLLWKYRPLGVAGWLEALAGLLYIGSGVMTATQMLLAVLGATSTSSLLLTVVFAGLPIVFGWAILRRSVGRTAPRPLRARAIMAMYGLLGLALWAGLLTGPVLAVAASVVPDKCHSRSSETAEA
jgi:hypothetical protein